MKKCPRCVFGSWVVGLSALAWGAVGALGLDAGAHGWARVAAGLVGAVRVGFLVYQQPFAPCPRCIERNRLSS